MTVKEMIEQLKTYPENDKVYILTNPSLDDNQKGSEDEHQAAVRVTDRHVCSKRDPDVAERDVCFRAVVIKSY